MTPLIIAVSAGIALFITFALAALYVRSMENNGNYSYEKQLNELIDYNDEPDAKPKVTPITMWNRYWGKLFNDLGMSGYSADNYLAGRNVAVAVVILIVALWFFFKSITLALIISLIATYAASVFMKNRATKKSDEISVQLPGFLNALKANVQANETPERALLKVVDHMPNPLYDDLIIVKNRILANATFKEALQDLSQHTASKDLKFLCACMIQASASGTNIEPQIDLIQQEIEERQRVNEEIVKAEKGALPAKILASVTIPGMLIYMMMTDSTTRQFWFKQPISYVALGVVVGLYFLGLWTVKRFVDSIRNM